MNRNMRAALMSAAAVLFAAISATAHAKLVDVTITGKVVDGFDKVGDFGAPNTSLDGDAFTAFVQFNTASGNREVINNVIDDLSGGRAVDRPTPVVNAYFEVGGVRFSIPGTDCGYVSAEDGGYTVISQYENAGGGDVYFQIFANSPQISIAVDKPFSGTVYDPHLSSSACYNNGDGARDWCTLSLDPSSMTIEPGGVPEPATWAMLMLGVGALGAALRAARRGHEKRSDPLATSLRPA